MTVEELAVKSGYTVENPSKPTQIKHTIQKVAVIGAGPAGLPTAKLLLDEGLDVKIFERNSTPGGTWNYREEKPYIENFPSEIPTKIVEPSLPPNDVLLPFTKKEIVNDFIKKELLKLNPPTPCYRSLTNNEPTPLLKYQDFNWKDNTPWYTTHENILQYLKDYFKYFKLNDSTEFNTSVEKLEELPDQKGWKVLTKHSEYKDCSNTVSFTWKEEIFDAVVVATGHYHAPYIPNISGLNRWKNKWPSSIIHSKQYRVPEEFKNKSVLLIGNGISAMDIARDISKYVNNLYQSVRKNNHKYDQNYLHMIQEISQTIPRNVKQVGGIEEFEFSENDHPINIQDGVIKMKDGTKLTNIDYIIFCTGYVFNYHFLENLHSDPYINEKNNRKIGDDKVLVKDGNQVFNLHKDIFYIPNPTLSFVGIPFHVATFSLFEFQSHAIARVYSKSASLPSEGCMRQEWNDRFKEKGPGREFHALGSVLEITYINDIVTWLNRDSYHLNKTILNGHDENWLRIRKNALPTLIKALKEKIK